MRKSPGFRVRSLFIFSIRFRCPIAYFGIEIGNLNNLDIYGWPDVPMIGFIHLVARSINSWVSIFANVGFESIDRNILSRTYPLGDLLPHFEEVNVVAVTFDLSNPETRNPVPSNWCFT